MESKRIVILISGRGSNMVSIIKAVQKPDFPAKVALVISNKLKARGLEEARKLGVKTLVIDHCNFASREDFDSALAEQVDLVRADLICLAGFMRLLSNDFVRKYKNRILNIHPSLLPAFTGLNAQRQTVEWGVKVSGCTVHFVDEELDHGPIVLQESVPVYPEDSETDLSERILRKEHLLYPQAVRLFCEDRLTVEGRKVYIAGYGNNKED